MLKRLCLVLVAGGALAACSESTVPTAPPARTPNVVAPNQAVIAELTCRVDATSMRCAPKGATSDDAFSPELIFGGQNKFVKLTSTNVSTVSGVSTTADVTIQNLTTQIWNTKDGVTADTGGVKVFFATGPTAGVTLHNGADGSDTFTAPNQPFYKYTTELGADQLLSPNETSAAKTWQFDLNGNTTGFTFSVLLVTKMQDETGPLHWKNDALSGSAFASAVWGASANDVWVGGDFGADGSHTLQHWDGASWTPFALAETVYGLWGSGSSDVFAAGTGGVEHWNGASWGVSYTSLKQLFTVWGSSGSNVYAGGDQGTLVNYNGSSWSAVTSNIGAGEQINSIWGSGPSDVYVATSLGAANAGLHHYDGSTWTTVTNAAITTALAVWGSSSTDVYVGGASGLLRHWNGTAWSTQNFFGTTSAITGIFGLSANSVYVVQDNGNLWHFNGSSWLLVSPTGFFIQGGWATTGNVFVPAFDNSTFDSFVVHGYR